MKKYTLLRKIYLYTFSLIGLIMVVIGAVRFIDMGLKTYVFKLADEQERVQWARPVMIPEYAKYKFENAEIKEDIKLSQEEYDQMKAIIEEYKIIEKEKGEIDPVIARKHRDAANSLAMILIGLPLYLFHWLTIRKELKKEA